MARIFSPIGPVASSASRQEEARQLVRFLVDHLDHLARVYPKGAEFVEEMAERLATQPHYTVSPKQLEWIRGIAERNGGDALIGRSKGPNVVWKDKRNAKH